MARCRYQVDNANCQGRCSARVSAPAARKLIVATNTQVTVAAIVSRENHLDVSGAAMHD